MKKKGDYIKIIKGNGVSGIIKLTRDQILFGKCVGKKLNTDNKNLQSVEAEYSCNHSIIVTQEEIEYYNYCYNNGKYVSIEDYRNRVTFKFNIKDIVNIIEKGNCYTSNYPIYQLLNFKNQIENKLYNVENNDRPWIIKNRILDVNHRNLYMIVSEDKELLISEKGLESVLVGNEALTTCYLKFKLGDKIESPKGTIGVICGNVYRIHNNGNIYTDYNINNGINDTLHPIMLWSSRNNEYATILNKPKELTPLEICNHKFKPGDHITSAEGKIGIIEGEFYDGGSGSIFCNSVDNGTLSLYRKSKDEYATIIKANISSISNDGKWLDKVEYDMLKGHERHMLNVYSSRDIRKPIVKSPEQVRFEQLQHAMSKGFMSINPSKEKVVPYVSKHGDGFFSLIKPKENKIIIPNEPIEIFIKRKK